MPATVLLQGITAANHETAIMRVLALPNPERITIGVAFLNARGLRVISHAIARVAPATTVFVGIRNGITSAQGLTNLLQIKCSIYAVDTGSRSRLFHPKIYASRNADEARVVVGSANLTGGGLASNVEASLCLTLPLREANNAAMVTDLEDNLYGMIATFPDHVFPITEELAIQQLLDSGRVVDEEAPAAPGPAGHSRTHEVDAIGPMPLSTTYVPLPTLRRPALRPVTAESPERPILVWQSGPLTRRALTIPERATTNPTGSMLFTKGAMDDIDQRHYFRDDVFGGLNWQPDPRVAHYERTTARFEIIVAGVSYGVFDLRISHNMNVESRAYAQGNSMTQLHWGAVRTLVAREELLARTIYLYKSDTRFIIEIE